jgi:hypothetical protein|tara:strand:- start:255 stop:683 length:429 start_codon:yes stop_codon:yes gene_type:complete
MKQFEEKEKFEFVLSIKDNIICQRFFTVRNHNPKTIKSIDLYETVKYIKDIINHELILKTIDIIDEFYKEDVSKLQEEKEYFTITIKKGNHLIMQRIFPADIYPPKVKFSVDIRPQISYILRELTDVLSDRKPYCYYLDKQL